jgi:hypothetical protein
MPWNESNRMDERLRFVARILEGEKMADDGSVFVAICGSSCHANQHPGVLIYADSNTIVNALALD